MLSSHVYLVVQRFLGLWFKLFYCEYIVPCWRYLLGYIIHHSVCDTVLFATLLVVITIPLYAEYRPADVLFRGGLLVSSLLEGWHLTLYVFPPWRLANNFS
jgi:hypothetical protein